MPESPTQPGPEEQVVSRARDEGPREPPQQPGEAEPAEAEQVEAARQETEYPADETDEG